MDWLNVSAQNTVGSISIGQTYWTMCDDWAWIAITFNRIHLQEEGVHASFDVKAFPDDLDFTGTMLYDEPMSPSVGTEMTKFSIKGKKVTILDDHLYDRYEQSCGFVVFVIRDKSTTTENL